MPTQYASPDRSEFLVTCHHYSGILLATVLAVIHHYGQVYYGMFLDREE